MNTSHTTPPESQPRNTTVLIVDDDAESLLLVGTMVEYVGYQPVTASSYEAALAGLEDAPTAIVLDLVMPDRCAERLLARLQETGATTPVVLMSAERRDILGRVAADYARLGVNVVSTLAKPFWVESLVAALEPAFPALPEHAIA